MPKQLPEPMVILPGKRRKPVDNPAPVNSDGRIPGRVYVDAQGKEWPWLSEQNPAVWLGGADEDEEY